LNPDHNPYSPPQAHVADASRTPRIKPRAVQWAVTALWVSYGLTFVHAATIIGDRWRSWPLEHVVLNQLIFELFYAAIIYFVSSGRHWALLVYAVFLGARTVNVILNVPDDWHSSHWLVFVTVLSFSCQYIAMYWLFAEPGRRWFAGSLAAPIDEQEPKGRENFHDQ
jgi:hypothetical protein